MVYESEPASLQMLQQIQESLQAIRNDYQSLTASVETINGRINILSGVKEVQDAAKSRQIENGESSTATSTLLRGDRSTKESYDHHTVSAASEMTSDTSGSDMAPSVPRRSSLTSRIILTTYPGQAGIEPVRMDWGHSDPMQRGPVVVSRNQNTVRRRNGAKLNFSNV